MEGFSARMSARMKQVQKRVDDLVYDTRASEVQLYNTFNELIMLSNTQFIENVSNIAPFNICVAYYRRRRKQAL